MDIRQKKQSLYDKNHKGWRGPILHRVGSLEKEERQDFSCPRSPSLESTETENGSLLSASTHSSTCKGIRIDPNHATLPNITWKSPPRSQHRRQRTSAFEWERRTTEGSLPCNFIQRRDFEMLQKYQTGHQCLVNELDRTIAKKKRMERLVKEIAKTREDNKHLSRQIEQLKASKKRDRGDQTKVGIFADTQALSAVGPCGTDAPLSSSDFNDHTTS